MANVGTCGGSFVFVCQKCDKFTAEMGFPVSMPTLQLYSCNIHLKPSTPFVYSMNRMSYSNV